MNIGRKRALAVGAQVRSTDGIVGTIEKLDWAGTAEGDALSTLVVRSQDGQRLYRVPATELGHVDGAGRKAIVHLRTERENLEQYRLEDQAIGAEGMESRRGAGSMEGRMDAESIESPRERPEDMALSAGDGMLRIPLAAEEITFEKQPITLGTVHVHKGIKTVEEAMTIPVDHEEAIIEHLSPEQYDGRAPADPNEIIIPVVEERVFVEKRPVVVEYIRVRKNVVTEQRDVKESVRKVVVEVTQEPQDGVDIQATPLFRDVTPSAPMAGG